jgi:four helix bundle protein
LEIWKRSLNIVETVYRITQSFPKEELYGLINQLRRAAVSIPANIAEGFARESKKEYKQFLYISLGSCSELITHMIVASRLKYIDNKLAEEVIDELEQISKMTMKLIKKITAAY